MQRLPFSVRARGVRPRALRDRRRRAAPASFVVGFVRGAFVGVVAAVVITGTSAGFGAAEADATGALLVRDATPPAQVVVEAPPSEPTGAESESSRVGGAAAAASTSGDVPAAAVGGGDSGGERPRPGPRPCPTYASPEAMAAAAAAS